MVDLYVKMTSKKYFVDIQNQTLNEIIKMLSSFPSLLNAKIFWIILHYLFFNEEVYQKVYIPIKCESCMKDVYYVF